MDTGIFHLRQEFDKKIFRLVAIGKPVNELTLLQSSKGKKTLDF